MTQKQLQKTYLARLVGFFEKHDLQWKHIAGIYIKGALAVLSCHSGFQTLIKANVSDTHYTIHCQVLMVKTMLNELLQVLNNAIKTLNL